MPISLNVMCWNIDLGRGSGEISSGLEAIAEQIISKQPDIVLLNEVRNFHPWWPGGRDQTAELAQMTNIQYFAFGALDPTGITGHSGNAVLSRYPISAPVVHKVMRGPSEAPGGYGSLHVVITISGIQHRVFSTRFTAYDAADNAAGHHQTADRVRSIDPRTPVILAGDFNSDPATEQAQYFAANSGLINVSDGNPDPMQCGGPGNGAIDRMFYRGPYAVATYQLRCPWGEPAASDHPWVFATLVESQPSQCEVFRGQINQRREQVRALQESKRGLDPRNPLDRTEILQINAQIGQLNSQMMALRQQADDLGCVW